jgi:hypothetical protein
MLLRTNQVGFVVVIIRIVQELTSWNEVAGAESAQPRLTMNSDQPWRRRLRTPDPGAENSGSPQILDEAVILLGGIGFQPVRNTGKMTGWKPIPRFLHALDEAAGK